MENPFDGLRPELRSEHDEIRKGIFSRALRNLQTAPLAERREWCRAIRATHTAAQAAKQRRSNVAASTTAATASANKLSLASAPAIPAPADGVPSSSPAVGTKRTHADVESDTSATTVQTSPAAAGLSAPVAPALTASTTAATTSAAPAPLSPLAAQAVKSSAVVEVEKEEGVTAQHVGEGEEEGEEESEASMKECIAAFLRGLLDRVVGMSLENLNVPALRILCSMVGIKTEVKNKIALYSTLSSFYYTECEKLGKRVSRDTVFTRQVEQEVAMLKHVSSTTNTTSAAAPSRRGVDRKAGSTPTTTTTNEDISPTSTPSRSNNNNNNKAVKGLGNSKAMPAAVVVSVTAKRAVDTAAAAKADRKKAAENNVAAAPSAKSRPSSKSAKVEDAGVDHYLKYENVEEELGDDLMYAKPVSSAHSRLDSTTNNNSSNTYSSDAYRPPAVRGVAKEESLYEENSDEGEVVYESRIFQKSNKGNSSAAKYAAPASSSSAQDSEEWSMLMLERKVASIVQLHDPVTVAIVVKKLSQLGYREPRADEVVEQILRRFHDRQLIYYDTGIAYLM